MKCDLKKNKHSQSLLAKSTKKKAKTKKTKKRGKEKE